MERIINMSEASAISASDYVLIDSPTQGTRKYLAANFSQGGGGGGVSFNEIAFSKNTDDASTVFLSSDGWYKQTGATVPLLRVGTANGMSLYGHDSVEGHFKFKVTTMPTGRDESYILGCGSSLCLDFITFDANGNVKFAIANQSFTTTATITTDTEYTLDYSVDIINRVGYYKIMADDTLVEERTITGYNLYYSNMASNWLVFSGNGGSYGVIGELYLPESYIKVDNTLIWGTEP